MSPLFTRHSVIDSAELKVKARFPARRARYRIKRTTFASQGKSAQSLTYHVAFMCPGGHAPLEGFVRTPRSCWNKEVFNTYPHGIHLPLTRCTGHETCGSLRPLSLRPLAPGSRPLTTQAGLTCSYSGIRLRSPPDLVPPAVDSRRRFS